MQRRDRHTNPRKAASRRNPSRWAAIKANSYPLSHGANRPGSATPTGLSSSGVSGCCCGSGSCSPTVFRSSSGRAPSISSWSCWKQTARLSQQRSSSAGSGRASWCRKGISRFRSLRCAERSARTAAPSALNSAGATDLPACSAQLSRRTRATLTRGQNCRLPEAYFPFLRGPISRSSKECMVSLGEIFAIRQV